MDVDPMEYVEGDDDGKQKARLNTLVAVTVALLATFMGICNVKDGNIVQAMQQAQADQIDNWGFYQARNIRQTVYETTIDELLLQKRAAPPSLQASYDERIAFYKQRAKEQEEKKKEPKKLAEDAKNAYDAWNIHDDQFDLADAMLALAIALLAVTSLTQKKWMFALAMVPTSLGVVMGIAGLCGLNLHFSFFAKLLGT